MDFTVRVYFAGRAYGYAHRPGVDFVGGDWWSALPPNSWNDKSSATHHCGLHHAKLHHASAVDQPRDSDPAVRVSYKEDRGLVDCGAKKCIAKEPANSIPSE